MKGNPRYQHQVLIWAAVAILLGGTACQPDTSEQGREAVEVDTAAIRAEIDSLRSAVVEAFNAGDVKPAVWLFVHPEALYSPSESPSIQRHDSATVSDRRTGPAGATIDIEPINVRVLAQEWAYGYGISTVTFKRQGSGTKRSAESTYLVIFRKTDGDWTVYRGGTGRLNVLSEPTIAYLNLQGVALPERHAVDL